jgi:O-antigen ligase
MVFPDSMRLNQPSKNNVRQWLGFAFALLVLAFPIIWFMSTDLPSFMMTSGTSNKMAYVMLVLFLLGVGQKTPRVYYKDRLIWLCTLLILMLVVGYIWQRFSVPEALSSGFSAKKYIPAFCFFVVMAYGINAAPRVSPFLLLISAGAGLIVHLSSLPADVWVAGWQGERLDFGLLRNANYASDIFATALLAGVFFLPRIFSLPFRARVLALPLLVGFILLMIFGVVATQSRAVWLGLVFSVIVLFLMGSVALLTGRYVLRWKTLTKVAPMGIGILLVGSAVFYNMGGVITHRASQEIINATTIKEMRLETMPRSSPGVRLGLWNAASEWIVERPIFGWGGPRAQKLIHQSPHFDEEFKSHYPHLHNSYLETLVCVGGAAFMCIIAIVFLVGWRIVMTWRQGTMPTDVFFFSCAFIPFWATVNVFGSHITNAAGFFLNAVIGGFVYSWYLRGQRDRT